MADVNFTPTEKKVVLAFLNEMERNASTRDRTPNKKGWSVVGWIQGARPWVEKGGLTTGQYDKLEQLIEERFSESERQLIMNEVLKAEQLSQRRTNNLERLFEQAEEMETDTIMPAPTNITDSEIVDRMADLMQMIMERAAKER